MIFIGCDKFDKSHRIIEIIKDKQKYDLHNAGEFLGFIFSIKNKSMVLEWKYYDLEGNPIDKFIRINCNDIIEFNISNRDNEMPQFEDECLEEIQFNDNDNILNFIFRGGQEIKIICKTLVFKLSDKSILNVYEE
jgi:hypothetical protein